MYDKDVSISLTSVRRDNERVAQMINRAWGAGVAWVAEVPWRNGLTYPSVKSLMVNGKVPGRTDIPHFKARA